MATATHATYRHSQRGPWSFVLLAFAIGLFGSLSFAASEPIAAIILPSVGALFLALAMCFNHLTVEDEGDRLSVRFGPLPLAQRRIRYDDIREVELGRTMLLDGFGIHMSVRGGWVWNIWGRECVVIKT